MTQLYFMLLLWNVVLAIFIFIISHLSRSDVVVAAAIVVEVEVVVASVVAAADMR